MCDKQKNKIVLIKKITHLYSAYKAVTFDFLALVLLYYNRVDRFLRKTRTKKKFRDSATMA